ncbi:hypothetical protein [Streptomyces sp. NBC_01235]|uniref:hypothetical protein n=1 Tax=Streptomyces sp. NBC_01235 TaxID=2903788 RepID=UPI002E12F6BF|nr:hypothetical protein OG289_19010 [Streptomyces sp. NBC_01235]
MPTETPNGHFTAGQLRAALWVLLRLAVPEAKAPDVKGFRGKKVPTRLLSDGLRTLMENFLLARRRGGDGWKAAVEVFQEIPGFLQADLPGSTMGLGEETTFIAGYDKQLADYRERFGPLLE